jgi:hypothetical protein
LGYIQSKMSNLQGWTAEAVPSFETVSALESVRSLTGSMHNACYAVLKTFVQYLESVFG